MIGAIEQALVDRITAANGIAGALGYQIRKIGSYGNQLDEADYAKLARGQFPAVWVMFAGEPRPEEAAGGIFEHHPVFTLIVAVRNRRNEKAARRGAAGKVGSYQLVEDVRALLIGQDLDLEIAPLRPGAVRSLAQGRVNKEDVSIYTLEILTTYRSHQAAPTSLDDFATFHADWDIAPHGNVTAPLPAADADAEDTVALETQP